MASMAPLTKTVDGELKERFTALGFHGRQRPYTISLAPGVAGWLGYGRTIDRVAEAVRISPSVGVIHEEVERRVAECRGETKHRPFTATIGVPLYSLAGRHRIYWALGDSSTVRQSTIDDLMECLTEFGLPYMRARLTLPELERALLNYESGGGALECAHRLPVVYLLQGRREEALEALEIAMERWNGDYPAARELRSFAANVREMVESTVNPLGS